MNDGEKQTKNRLALELGSLLIRMLTLQILLGLNSNCCPVRRGF